MSGYLALILHAHLPFVRHPEQEHFLEEDWLLEAISESYIPLVQMMQRLTADCVPFKLTMSVTPSLCAMLQDDLLQERYVRHLELLIDLAQREIERNRKQPAMRELATFYHELFSSSRTFFVEQCNCDLLAMFRKLRAAGSLEIVASAATHGLLPLIQQQSMAAARAQVLIGCDVYKEIFHASPNGFWLPECAYAPGVEVLLQEANLRWFIVDTHGLMFGEPQPQRAIYAPYYTPAGPAFFARDQDSSRQVWSAREGYPGDPNYRDFYRDAGFDLPLEQLGTFSRSARKFTGLKYHRVTGQGVEKGIYDRLAAQNTADGHAAHFLEQRREQIRSVSKFNFDPVVVVPFDAELFGHWWFEGPLFLEFLIRRVAGQEDFVLTTPGEFLASHPSQQTMQPAASTWGEEGHLRVWLDPGNVWIYPHLHAATRRMHEAAQANAKIADELIDRVLKQMARELLLAQSSDWPFLVKTQTASEYASKRVREHLLCFNQLYDQLATNRVDTDFLAACEGRDNLFPNLNWRYYV